VAVLLFSACPAANGTGDEDTFTGEGAFEDLFFQSAVDTDTIPSNIKYFSLSQGKELDASKKATAEWDIALEALGAFFYIYTNSGITAEVFGPTGGQGGVWFTNTTDFDDVVLTDRVTDFSGEYAEYADYVADSTRYQYGMSGPVEGRMNIMTYYGYEDGDGLSAETAFAISADAPFTEPFFKFNKKAFCNGEPAMPPIWHPTGQVYVIKHGAGNLYSKFQVTAFRYQSGYRYTLSFKFKNLEE
jgi:hypothetical protein